MRTSDGTGDEPLDGTFKFEELIEEPTIVQSPLNVYVELIDLLREFDGNQEQMFDFLGKVKDLLA